MRKVDVKEAVTVLRTALDALRKAAPNPDLSRACGALAAGAEEAIAEARLGESLLECFTLASEAGIDFDAMGRVRRFISDIVAIGPPAVAVRSACLQMALAEESRAVSLVTLKSRADADGWVARMNAAFDPVEDDLAGDDDQTPYRAITALHAAVVRDLTMRGLPLPRMVAVSFPTRLPALTIANRLYGDADRSDEVIDGNRVVHPLFVSREIAALSQ